MMLEQDRAGTAAVVRLVVGAEVGENLFLTALERVRAYHRPLESSTKLSKKSLICQLSPTDLEGEVRYIESCM